MNIQPIVFVADDDAGQRDAIRDAVQPLGVRSALFATLDEWLDAYRDQPGCLVASLEARTTEGRDVLEELRRRGGPLPLVAVAERPRAADVVRALRRGAATVVDAPIEPHELRAAVQEALAADAERRRRREELAVVHARLGSLNDREREVLRMIVAGRPNKAMANHLGASLRTVENSRREVFTKLKVRSVAELVTIVLRAEGAADL